MKIDFLEKGMSISFDKVPRLLYFNEEGKSCGAVFLDGQRIKRLQEVDISAETTTEKVDSGKLYCRIKNLVENSHNSETKIMGECKTLPSISIKITDIEEIQKIISVVRLMARDCRIPDFVRD